jgi:zinc transport system substrate-binding protein
MAFTMYARSKFLPRMALYLIVLSIVCPVAACSVPKDAGLVDSRLTIAVTIPPQKAFVAAVCGDRADIEVLVPPGNSPGNYEPDAMQMQQLSGADVYFTIGVATEKANILPRVSHLPVFDLAAAVSEHYPDRLLAPESRDPHIWLSVRRVKVMIEVIADEVSRLDPEYASLYQANAQDYLEQLDTLEQDMAALLSGASGQTVLVYHPSFGYLADEYGLEMLALEQDGKEATPQHLQELVDLACQKSIRTIFCQAEIDSRQSAAFAEEIGASIVVLYPLAEDYLENMRAIASAFAGVTA